MQTQLTAAVNAARNSEATLVNAINQTAATLDTVATNDLNIALTNLANSIKDVKDRLTEGRSQALDMLAGMMSDLDGFNSEVTAPPALVVIEPVVVPEVAVVVPEPIQEPTPEPIQEPTPEPIQEPVVMPMVAAEPEVVAVAALSPTQEPIQEPTLTPKKTRKRTTKKTTS